MCRSRRSCRSNAEICAQPVSVQRHFSVLTLITNVLGALAIGAIAGGGAPGTFCRTGIILKTGVCGGFTTFSTFSLETYELLNQGHYGTALLYMAASLVLCWRASQREYS